jgi:hypothetical protein
MTKLNTTLAACALALAPAVAHGETTAPTTFEYAGQAYTYTTEQVGEKQVLRGHTGPSREPFVLTVGKRWVEGTVNGNPVSFSLKSVKHLKGIVVVEQMAVR